MRSIASYILAALVIGLMLDIMAPALGSATSRWPSVEASTVRSQQTVNRDGKADRLSGASTLEKTVREIPHPTPVVRPVPEGCDPAFSPLSVSARLNFAARCVADASDNLKKPV